jgi:hypothetical protein
LRVSIFPEPGNRGEEGNPEPNEPVDDTGKAIEELKSKGKASGT